jgi:hypothetical protein
LTAVALTAFEGQPMNSQHLEEVVAAVVESFNQAELEQLLDFRLTVRLDTLVDVHRPFSDIVYEAILPGRAVSI